MSVVEVLTMGASPSTLIVVSPLADGEREVDGWPLD